MLVITNTLTNNKGFTKMSKSVNEESCEVVEVRRVESL